MGHRVSSWSLHLVERQEDLPGENRWRHALFSAHDLHIGRFPTEILVADADGDMPTVEFWNGRQWDIVPHYSTDMAAAWDVVECLQRVYPGWRFSLLGGDEQWGYLRLPDEIYEVDKTVRHSFGWHAEFFGHEDPTQNTGQAYGAYHAETASLAICLAALKAVGA